MFKTVLFSVLFASIIVGSASVIVIGGSTLYNAHLKTIAEVVSQKRVVTLEETVAINSQPCTLPTSTNNEVQINER